MPDEQGPVADAGGRTPGGGGDPRDATVLRLSRSGTVVFASSRPWLHPLLDLTRFLETTGETTADCELYDKIVGRAAALLMVRLGIRSLRTGIMSERAIPVLEANGVTWHADARVERIDCLTEDILANETDSDTAYRIIRARARAAAARDPAQCALILENVNLTRGGQSVLQDVNLRVGRGEKILITGANGAGKTTLLKTILGSLSPMTGSVQVSADHTGESRTGYVNQESVSVSFPISAQEVVAIGVAAARASRGEKEQRVHDAMAVTRCTPLATRMYATLSGGEKQRVAIARCLAQNARVLLLDEPTASLDTDGKRELVSLVERLADDQEITVIMVTHEFDTMDRSGWRHLVIEDGALSTAEDAP
ncbi:MAG: DUF1893 domain-containing protein [Spirochaetaceae bacterium]|nr:MAG: DUF1893 domain-containing protein [Spirochaetaceae bacterium]